ncbi:mavicyanin-like [Juglans microcarpa x Juglans regia]|uniref:mavicyanin-like n=1 Tax=Juglans microcarpa x Juglans regia TaxID=2249226 RepID=UPI001B7DB82D|nr:mavicyanin-like [Juglans microcarpa x Juglans regia]
MKAFTPFLVLAIAATLAPSILAKEFLVGDSTGWTINYDYESWVKGKEFHVGDKLVFKYPKGIHNVIRVDNATAYENCLASTETETLSSGNDVITLTTPGKIWYICGVSRHCEEGEQKIAIEVLPQKLSSGSEPSPSTSASKGSSFAHTHHHGWMIANFGILVMTIIV